MRTWLLRVVSLMIAFGPAGAAEIDPVVMDRARDLVFPGYFGGRPSIDLHHRTFAFPDGVKGVQILRILDGIFPDRPVGIKSDVDHELWAGYCASTVIVSAVNIDSVAALTSDKSMIFTISRFRVVDVVRQDDGVAIGTELRWVRPGGELVDDGERLRAVLNGFTPLVAGATYFLELYRNTGLPADTFVTDRRPIEVKDSGVLTPAWKGMKDRRYDVLKRDMQRVAALAPCWPRR